MNFYEEYKPFRNYMRRFELVPGLVDVWCYSLHVMEVSPYRLTTLSATALCHSTR